MSCIQVLKLDGENIGLCKDYCSWQVC